MPRKILFRGKRIDNGEWVYGSFIPDLLEVFYEHEGLDGFIKPFGKTKEERIMVAVERETVGQYTGLTDKNGMMIFEGDIVRYIDPDSQEFDPGEKCLAGWDEDTACMVFECFAYGQPIMYELFDKNQAKNLEVIGNIHDDPKLLKEARQCPD